MIQIMHRYGITPLLEPPSLVLVALVLLVEVAVDPLVQEVQVVVQVLLEVLRVELQIQHQQ